MYAKTFSTNRDSSGWSELTTPELLSCIASSRESGIRFSVNHCRSFVTTAFSFFFLFDRRTSDGDHVARAKTTHESHRFLPRGTA